MSKKVTLEEYRKLIEKKSKSKYGNNPIVLGIKFRNRTQDIWFQSCKEMEHIRGLILLQDRGMISELCLQEKFLLIKGSDSEKPLYFVADAVYRREDGKWVVLDVKGFKTRVYLNKRKLFKSLYPQFEFIEV